VTSPAVWGRSEDSFSRLEAQLH